MSRIRFHEWFRCPICGDSGDTVVALVSRAGSVEFSCTSRQHRLDHKNFQKYGHEDWRRDTKPSLFERFFGETSDRMRADLANCIKCPHCGSSNTDGAIELIDVRHNYGEKACIHATVWCRDCTKSQTTQISHGNDTPTEKIESKSEYPPDYL